VCLYARVDDRLSECSIKLTSTARKKL
jgi:hypothetical protein